MQSRSVYTLYVLLIPIFAHFYDALQLVLSNEKCLITHTQFVHRPFAKACCIGSPVYISHEF